MGFSKSGRPFTSYIQNQQRTKLSSQTFYNLMSTPRLMKPVKQNSLSWKYKRFKCGFKDKGKH